MIYDRRTNWDDSLDEKIYSMISDRTKKVRHSYHCSERIVENYLKYRNCFKRRYNLADVNRDFLLKGTPIKAEVLNGKVTKAYLRVPYNETKNLVVVVGFSNKVYENSIFCITIWVEFKNEFKRRGF